MVCMERLLICRRRNADHRSQDSQALVLAMPLVDFVTSGKIVPPLLGSDFSVTWKVEIIPETPSTLIQYLEQGYLIPFRIDHWWFFFSRCLWSRFLFTSWWIAVTFWMHRRPLPPSPSSISCASPWACSPCSSPPCCRWVGPLTTSWVCSVAQSCQMLCDPIDCSPPGSSVSGIVQARILKWVAVSFFPWLKTLDSRMTGMSYLISKFC